MSQKTVLITGTTSGIGEATAHIFAENNYRIILNGRRVDRLEKQAKELKEKYNCSTFLMPVDVRDNDAVIAFFKQLPENWQNIDVLVNNAGLAAGLEGIEDGDVS